MIIEEKHSLSWVIYIMHNTSLETKDMTCLNRDIKYVNYHVVETSGSLKCLIHLNRQSAQMNISQFISYKSETLIAANMTMLLPIWNFDTLAHF